RLVSTSQVSQAFCSTRDDVHSGGSCSDGGGFGRTRGSGEPEGHGAEGLLHELRTEACWK
ncbi:unnamed protein product, partial [Polarella glacialis]